MKKLKRLIVATLLLLLMMPTLAFACKDPNHCYMTLTYTGAKHNVKAYFTGISIHSGNTVMNNKITTTAYAYTLLRVTNGSGAWESDSSTTSDASTTNTATVYTSPLTRYLTKGKASCKVHCYSCNMNETTTTAVKSTSSYDSGTEFQITF